MSKINKDQIVQAISNMSVLEIMELIKLIEDKFNVTIANLQPSHSYKESQSNENIEQVKSEFNIILKSIGKNKIAVIRTIRNILGLGLKEAKDFVESAPKIIKEKTSKEEVEKIKTLLLESGAVIEIH